MAEEDLKAIGRFQWKRPHTPYEEFIEEEGIPIVRGLGVYDVRDLDLKPWNRLGGNGAYLELSGLGNKAGLYVVEIPPRGALNREKHMYEEMYYVVEGRGSTESLARRAPRKEAAVRMAEKQPVLAATQHLAPPGERLFKPGALAGRDQCAADHGDVSKPSVHFRELVPVP